MNWYQDWQFWTVIVSALALAISLLPYAKVMLKKGKLQIEKHRSFFITHRVGSPNINLHLTFKNIGGATVTIKSVKLVVTKDKLETFELVGNGYLIQPNDQYFALLTPFDLKSNNTWSHTVNFHEFWSRKKQQKYRNLESRIRDHIQSELRSNPPEPGHLVQAAEEDVQDISELFEENYRWESGEYEVKIIILDGDNKHISNEQFTFTLFESEADEFLSYKDDLKYGYGVYLAPSNRIHGINIDMA
jgi:hypothetical protein